MPTFVTIGYGDSAGYERTSSELRDAAHDHDASLRAAGAVMGIAGRPVQVRNPAASGVTRVDGPFLSAPLPVAGFALIEAADLEAAVDLAAKTTCAIAHRSDERRVGQECVSQCRSRV